VTPGPLAGAAAVAGEVLLGAGAALLVAAGLAVVPSALRTRRRALALRATVVASHRDVTTALHGIAGSVSEASGHAADVAQVLRWVRHPLVAATLQWYLRRRRRG
jgi:hypothetical protein